MKFAFIYIRMTVREVYPRGMNFAAYEEKEGDSGCKRGIRLDGWRREEDK